jgi:hypothetical protein
MAWYEDLQECTYLGVRLPILKATGWLERGKPFPVGEVDRRIYAALLELRRDPWMPSTPLGWHDCDLCLYEAEAQGARNLFIPGRGVIYFCPELITHYMSAHGYQPPGEFCDAVLACPPMRSMQYLRAILAAGGRDLVRSARGVTTNQA